MQPEKNPMDKHSSLFGLNVIKEKVTFITLTPVWLEKIGIPESWTTKCHLSSFLKIQNDFPNAHLVE
jgi:hypothetical protein